MSGLSQTFFLRALASGLWALLAQASRPTTRLEDALPGEPAVHVTRLHRYDHRGLDAVLEAEERWSRGEVAPSAPASFVQISSKQMEALRSHHRLAHEERHGSGPALKRTRGEASTLRIKSRASRGYIRYNTVHSNEPPAIELDKLASQYVGPIGVGTKITPAGCTVEEGRSLAFISYADVSNSNSTGTACHLQDQSDIWVVLDTGSTNIWVNSDLCKAGACAKAERNRYNHGESITYEPPKDPVMLNITFGTGKVSGVTAVDDLHVGPYTVTKQTFGMIEVQDGRVFDEVPFEGILGLAFPRMSANGATPFFDNIIKQKVLDKNEFSFYFSLDNPSANAVFWGGADPKFYKGDLEHFKVVDPFYWSISLLQFKIGNEVLLGDTKAASSYLQSKVVDTIQPKAIVDTGTTFFTAESALFGKITDKIGTKDCSEITEKSHPPITFRLSNTNGKPVDFVLSNMQYMTQSEDGLVCSPAFMRIDIPSQHGPAMVLGEVFLRHYFSVFSRGDGTEDDATVGFAKAAHGDETVRELRRMTHRQPGFLAAHGKPKAATDA